MKNSQISFFLGLCIAAAIGISTAAEPGTPIIMGFNIVVRQCVEPISDEQVCADKAAMSVVGNGVFDDDDSIRTTSSYKDSIEVFPGIPRARAASGERGDFMWHVEPGYPEEGRILVKLQYEYSLAGNKLGSTSKGTTAALLTLDGEAFTVSQSMSTVISDAQRITRIETSYLTAKMGDP
ncbi:MAG: hypothetical protein AAGG55_14390 [Pseudomonadota bacterium]